MNEFIITFRECFEAALIVGIIYIIVDKNGYHSQKKMIGLSVLMAVLASVVLGIVLNRAIETMGESTLKELLEGIFMYVTAALLFYVVFWMSKNLASKKFITEQTTKTLEGGKKWGLFFLVFFAILREGFETALFLVGSTVENQSFSYIGFFSGITLAVLIGYFIVIEGKKIQLRKFFSITSFLLVLFASGMVSYGTAEIQEYMENAENKNIAIETPVAEQAEANKTGTKENSLCAELTEGLNGSEGEEEEYAFEIFKTLPANEKPSSGLYKYYAECGVYVNIFNEQGAVGTFLQELFGYDTNPSWTQLILWLASIVFGTIVWRRAYSART